MAGGFFQKDSEDEKKSYEIPYIGRADESGKNLGKEFYEKSLGIMTLGSLLCSATTLWRLNSAILTLNSNLIPLYIGIAVFSLLCCHIYCAKGSNGTSLCGYLAFNWALGELIGRLLFSFIPEFELAPINKMVIIIGSVFLSVNGGIWLNSIVKTRYNQSSGTNITILYFFIIQLIIGLICGFITYVFLVELVLMGLVLLGTALGVGDASLSIEEGNWMGGVLAVFWYSFYIMLRFGRLIFYLLYIILRCLK
ncbi:hypothetical protein NEF87_000885 [Candidatus Lokiarchaeum ossiferum]|uniref:Uncharacterized protein n=1 Tax=Candidatus Lokiarchaeum ossiferum TaxID=2951803 RepID=A0ABY6HMI7_9ARCH|nr:hypothetical protein NEF87_000885 [Candidatus Lokiarchaeum sp. B-35]